MFGIRPLSAGDDETIAAVRWTRNESEPANSMGQIPVQWTPYEPIYFTAGLVDVHLWWASL